MLLPRLTHFRCAPQAIGEQKQALDKRDKAIEQKETGFTQTHAAKLAEIDAKAASVKQALEAAEQKQKQLAEKSTAVEEAKKALEARAVALTEKEKACEAQSKTLAEVGFPILFLQNISSADPSLPFPLPPLVSQRCRFFLPQESTKLAEATKQSVAKAAELAAKETAFAERSKVPLVCLSVIALPCSPASALLVNPSFSPETVMFCRALQALEEREKQLSEQSAAIAQKTKAAEAGLAEVSLLSRIGHTCLVSALSDHVFDLPANARPGCDCAGGIESFARTFLILRLCRPSCNRLKQQTTVALWMR